MLSRAAGSLLSSVQDVEVWANAKLSQDAGLTGVVSQIDSAKLQMLGRVFCKGKLDQLVKVRLLIACLLLPKAKRAELQEELCELARAACNDDDEWVRVMGYAVDGFSGHLNLDAVMREQSMVDETVRTIWSMLDGAQPPASFMPLQELYLHPDVRTLPPAAPATHQQTTDDFNPRDPPEGIPGVPDFSIEAMMGGGAAAGESGARSSSASVHARRGTGLSGTGMFITSKALGLKANPSFRAGVGGVAGGADGSTTPHGATPATPAAGGATPATAATAGPAADDAELAPSHGPRVAAAQHSAGGALSAGAHTGGAHAAAAAHAGAAAAHVGGPHAAAWARPIKAVALAVGEVPGLQRRTSVNASTGCGLVSPRTSQGAEHPAPHASAAQATAAQAGERGAGAGLQGAGAGVEDVWTGTGPEGQQAGQGHAGEQGEGQGHGQHDGVEHGAGDWDAGEQAQGSGLLQQQQQHPQQHHLQQEGGAYGYAEEADHDAGGAHGMEGVEEEGDEEQGHTGGVGLGGVGGGFGKRRRSHSHMDEEEEDEPGEP